MSRLRVIMTATVLTLVSFAAGSHAQGSGSDVYWHIDPTVKTCSMVIDPSLTQEQWHRFTRQAGALVTFKALAPATVLGKKGFSIAIDGGYTPVDQHDPAWINTFTHPDETCPLGDAISFPALRARFGVSDQVDVGGFWTTAPRANYGLVGAEVQYAFLAEKPGRPAAAARASAVVLTGVPDFAFGVYSVDVLASKRVASVTPYVGVKESYVVGRETTDKVDLRTERNALTQGFVGLAYSVWQIGVAAEYNVSSVNTLALALGYRR